jgi:hypothetical protein
MIATPLGKAAMIEAKRWRSTAGTLSAALMRILRALM